MLNQGLSADNSPTKMVTKIIFTLATLLTYTNAEYIPPGPVYPCPNDSKTTLLYPCVCEKGSDTGLYIRCENTGLAVLSVGLGNIAGLGLPVERLLLKELKISNLFGPLFHRSTIRVLQIEDTPIRTIDQYAFAGVNRTLQELYMINTQIDVFPKDAFMILGNLSVLSIDGHKMTKLAKDIFAGSELVGKLERLHLSNGLIADIPPEAFQVLKKLKKLDLHGNKLVTLKRNQFKGLRDTELLDLSHNSITKLDGSHIGDLTKLGWCNASHNQIGEIPRGMFARNTVIKVVHLDHNKIKKLDTNSFRGMRFLRRLYLQDNLISDIGRGTFSAVTRIGTVDLARNQIKKVDFQMFQQVKYAEIINLAENNITIIETQAFTDLYQAVVNISHNALSTIETGAFVNCNNMTLLDFSHNQLSMISPRAFDENSYAYELQVSHNEFRNFSQIPIQNMTGIQKLNVSHNKIESIPKLAFPKLYELHTVDMSHNNLSEIFNAVFQNLFSIRFLNLSYNSLETIKPATFGTIPTVLELNLSHNRLREISRGSLAKLVSCRLIDISYNVLEKLFQIPISLGELNVAHNNITSIKPNTWPTMNALLRLNLSANQLADSLQSDSFSSLLTLQALDLSANGLTKPPWEALSSLTSLQYLYLQENNITELSRSAFGNLPTTFKIDLSRNQIATVAQRSFNGLQQLLDLSLSGNRLESVPNEAFKGLVALRKLDLSHNFLEKIDNKTNGLLDDCLSLEEVNLSHNKIGFLTKKMFPSNPWIPYRLRDIDLSYNEIPVVTHDLTLGAKKVKKLNLAGNYINDVRNNVLGNLTSLEILDLSHNNLKDLVSRTSEIKFTLPENITELILKNNSLGSLPTPNIMSSKYLKLLDVRNNQLTSFEPELVRKIKHEGLVVLFQGNSLKCDCFTRPLKHYLNHIRPSLLKTDEKYQNITCAEPVTLVNENILTIDEDRLLCSGNTEIDAKILEHSNTEGESAFDFTAEPDLAFRDVQYSQTSIYAHWFITTNEDVGDFILYIRDATNKLLYSSDVAYNLRSLTIPIDETFKISLQDKNTHEICIQAKNSNNTPKKWHPNQCQKVLEDFNSWPVKLVIDKRRLTKKKVKYSWFGNSVLGLVSDSILITLCIFLSVCLKITDDL
ncbi:toll-like receptor Tollo [Helicoverpa zea]|uniref:toll-like receptor Tollo n=1 Tax=Helicoverpa zea TaxID=7113 RepID=UPI001F59C04F|nr:toll-like receptor Tollo [Helicoverpa zea]